MHDLDRTDFIKEISSGNLFSRDMFYMMAMFNFNKCSKKVSERFFNALIRQMNITQTAISNLTSIELISSPE